MNKHIFRTIDALWKQYDSIKLAQEQVWLELHRLEKQLQEEEE